MQTEIISIGDELLLGQTINTNAAWMGKELHEAGLHLRQVTTITDSREHILRELKASIERVDVVLITGGLGPTRDDITKETLCEFFDTHLVMNEEVLAMIRDYFRGRGVPLLPVNEQQAALPEKARVLINRRGTAMGMWFEEKGKIVVSMPGVPHEMEGMMKEEILPELRKRFGDAGSYYQVIQTIGTGESRIAQIINQWEERIRSEGLSLAYLPSSGMVRLRVSGPVSERSKIDFETENLVNLLGDMVFARGESTLQEAVGQMLKNAGKKLAVAESCTGGYLAYLITSVPGSSEYFSGGVVSYSNEMKINLLGVSTSDLDVFSPVSEQVACGMAIGVKNSTGADVSLSITGIAGPDGGTSENPVGTVWIGISHPHGTVGRRFSFGRNRERNIRVAALFALDILRKHLQGIDY